MQIKLNIVSQTDREAIVIALANNGYSVKIERVESVAGCDDYLVIFDYPYFNDERGKSE